MSLRSATVYTGISAYTLHISQLESCSLLSTRRSKTPPLDISISSQYLDVGRRDDLYLGKTSEKSVMNIRFTYQHYHSQWEQLLNSRVWYVGRGCVPIVLDSKCDSLTFTILDSPNTCSSARLNHSIRDHTINSQAETDAHMGITDNPTYDILPY
jgi:hypothetical protein